MAALQFRRRPSEMADLAPLRSWFPDVEALRHWGGPDVRFPLDEAQFGQMLAEARGNAPLRRCFSFEQDGALAGHVQVVFTPLVGVCRLARVAVAPHLRGQGGGYRFLHSLIAMLFDDRLARIELNVYPGNMAARRLYRKLGFVEDRSSSARHGIGDVILMGLTRRRFTARCRAST